MLIIIYIIYGVNPDEYLDVSVSLLAFTASVTSTFAYWSNSPRKIRMVNLVCASPCWLAYDVIVYSLGGIVSESITIISILVSFVRFGWKGLEHDTVRS